MDVMQLAEIQFGRRDSKHQVVDFLDHLRSRPQVGFGEAVERSIHQVVPFCQWSARSGSTYSKPVTIQLLRWASSITRRASKAARWDRSPSRGSSG